MAAKKKTKGNDIKLVLSNERIKDINAALTRRSKILGRVRSYESSTSPGKVGRNANFVASPYELSEISRAIDVESYIAQSVKKHRIYVLKEGYELSGDDEQTIEYVRNRLFEIAMVTAIPTVQWLRELVTNVIQYHNGYLVFRRDKERSSGKTIKIFNKEIKPIAGIFVGDPLSLGVEIDKFGTPVRWKQNLSSTDGQNTDVYLEPEDVVHITVDRKTGMVFGTPYLVSVLDDVRALRKLEELVLVIAEKEAYPLYHYKVGSETRPATVLDDGSDEVSLVLSQLQGNPSNGYIVTSERHEVSLISRDKSAFDLTPLLEYFEKRVLGGLSLSDIDLGRGGTANRSTASTISKNLEDSAKDYQQIIAAHLTQFLMTTLLLEGGFDVTTENMVHFKFPLSDTDEVRSHQNHGFQMFAGNAISREEFRKGYLNKNSAINEEDTMMNKQLQADITLAKATPKPASSSKGTSSRAVKNVAKNRARPANQYGSTIKSRTKKKRDGLDEVLLYLDSLKNGLSSLNNPSEDDINKLFLDFCNKSTTVLSEVIKANIDAGFEEAEDQFYDEDESSEDLAIEPIGSRAVGRFLNNFVSKSFWKSINPYKSAFLKYLNPDEDNNTSSFELVKSFEVIAKSMASLYDDQIITSRRFGFAKFAKRSGHQYIELRSVDEEEVEQINISEVVYKDLIPTDKNKDYTITLPVLDN